MIVTNEDILERIAFTDENDMLEHAIKYLMHRKYNGYRVYLHNFSHFVRREGYIFT